MPAQSPPSLENSSISVSIPDRSFQPDSNVSSVPLSTDPPILKPYWIDQSKLPFKSPEERVARIPLEELVLAALANSPHIKAVLTVPQIRETEIQQAKGVFDPNRFANSIWNDRSDPIGNTLTTGGPSRLNDNNLQNSFGVRSKNQYGGSLEASQDIGLKDTNSLFFQPHQQADTKLLVRYTQPLMKGAGTVYNRSAITIAEIQQGIATREATLSMQEHALDITQDFWNLAYYRNQRLQRQRGLDRLGTIADQLRERFELDAVKNQYDRARAAVERIKGSLVRTDADILKLEAGLRQKVNASWIQYDVCDEIIPSTEPLAIAIPIDPESELDAAIGGRSDILALQDEMRAASIRLKVSQNDLKPTLNLLTDFYVRGLNGDYDVGRSISDQFETGAPSYSAGLEFQRPKKQTIAKAIRNQRNIEMQQLLFKIENKFLVVRADVQSSIADVDASFATLKANEFATMATKDEVQYLMDRWEANQFLDPTQISQTLDQLLDAEQRLISSEDNWAQSQKDYMISLARLRFASGQILDISKEAIQE